MRRTVLVMALLLMAGSAGAQNAPINSVPQHQGYGAANAGGTGKLPPAPHLLHHPARKHSRHIKRGTGAVSGQGGAPTGAGAGSSTQGVGTGGTNGAGSK